MIEDLPLSILFEQARAALPSAYKDPKADLARVQRAILALQQCEKLVRSLGIFSSNEDADDISTGDLPYLLVPFYLAELKSKVDDGKLSERTRLLGALNVLYERFLDQLDSYGLLPPDAKEPTQLDPTSKREQKLARFRREKDVKARLAEWQLTEQRRLRLRELEGKTNVTEETSLGEGDRDMWLATIELAALQAANQIPLIKQELEMLEHASGLSEEERQKPLPPPPADLMRQLRAAADGLESRREQLRSEVFRPSHNLPTRTLREQAQIEVRQAQEAQEAQQRAEAARALRESDEDAELARQRAWDDWKDDNPRGAGNSRLKPTA